MLPVVQAFATRHGAKIELTAAPRHAMTLAARAVHDGYELVVAVGGDGTMNEVASALVATPSILGLVPCGSGDGLGRHLRIHGPVTRALAILVSGQPRLIDSGLADGHPFFTVAGLGFEAEIADRFNRLSRRGFLPYVLLAARAFAGWRPQEFAVTDASGTRRLRAFTLAVANASQYGNQARIAPRARVDDGRLDLCAIPPLSPWNALPLAARLFAGTLDRAASVVARQSERFVVERAVPGLLHTDGETHPAGTRIEFQVRPASLRLLVPAP